MGRARSNLRLWHSTIQYEQHTEPKKISPCPLQKTEERFTYNFRYYLGLSPHQQHVYWSGFVLGGSPCHSGREAGHSIPLRAAAAAERASCDRVDEVAAASRLGRLVVRFGLRSHPPDGGATDPSYAERRRRGRDQPLLRRIVPPLLGWRRRRLRDGGGGGGRERSGTAGRTLGGVEQGLVVAGGRDPRRRGVRRVAVPRHPPRR